MIDQSISKYQKQINSFTGDIRIIYSLELPKGNTNKEVSTVKHQVGLALWSSYFKPN